MAKKLTLKNLCPPFIVDHLSRTKRALDDRRRRKMAVKEIFTEIYDNKLWGGGTGKFHSGSGSADDAVTEPYIRKISKYLSSYPKKPSVVDLGCGDFSVGRHLVRYCSKYTGVDIVAKLIRELNKTQASTSVKFLCVDIIDKEPPAGDIAFLRQVLQHLSNEQILKILPKLKKYKTVFITEHYPSKSAGITHNKDIVPGSAIRLYKNSGVYLDKPPFNIPKNKLKLFLQVQGSGLGKGLDQGVIRTYKLDWSAKK